MSTESRAYASDEAIELYGGWIKQVALHVKARMPWAELDELIQWGVLGMLEARERFQPDKGQTLKTFAAKRVRGAMLDGLRREGTHQRHLGEVRQELAGGDAAVTHDDPLTRVLQEDDRRQLVEALERLGDRQRLVLALYYYEGLNNREIARVLEVSEARASVLRKRALEALARTLEAQPDPAISGERS